MLQQHHLALQAVVMTMSAPVGVASIGRTVGSSLASLDMEAAMDAVRSFGDTGLNRRRRTSTRAFSGCFAAWPIIASVLPSACFASCAQQQGSSCVVSVRL